MPVLHVSQIAAALGLPGEPVSGVQGLGWDAASLLDAWLGQVRSLPWELLIEPTPSRGRSLRNLTVNIFHPFELLPAAWGTSRFEWDPDGDDAREAVLVDRDALVRFGEQAGAGWERFLLSTGEELGSRDPLVSSPRGDVPFSALVSFQRWHAAFHYRQLLTVLGVGATALDSLAGLDLPAEIF